jgi:hypothetical protein
MFSCSGLSFIAMKWEANVFGCPFILYSAKIYLDKYEYFSKIY